MRDTELSETILLEVRSIRTIHKQILRSISSGLLIFLGFVPMIFALQFYRGLDRNDQNFEKVDDGIEAIQQDVSRLSSVALNPSTTPTDVGCTGSMSTSSSADCVVRAKVLMNREITQEQVSIVLSELGWRKSSSTCSPSRPKQNVGCLAWYSRSNNEIAYLNQWLVTANESLPVPSKPEQLEIVLERTYRVQSKASLWFQ